MIVGTAGPVVHRMEELPGTVSARGVVVAGTIAVGAVGEGSIVEEEPVVGNCCRIVSSKKMRKKEEEIVNFSQQKLSPLS